MAATTQALMPPQGCALAEPGGLWHLTFVLGQLENLCFFIEIICWAYNFHCAVSSVYDEDLDDQGHKFIIKPVKVLTICGLSFSLLFSLLLSSLFAAAISFQTTNGQMLAGLSKRFSIAG